MTKSPSKKILLRFRVVDRDIFEAIRRGQKKVETRAITIRYQGIQVGDEVTLVCGNKKIKRLVYKTEMFKSIDALLKKHKPQSINPKIKTSQEAREMWYSFPGYKDKIKKHGLVAIHLK